MKQKIIKVIEYSKNFASNRKFLLLTLLPVIIYGIVMSCHTMPFAEGWYTYYGECIQNGETVYKDFDYLFTPFYIHFIALFISVFGSKIIVLRILGIFIYSLIAIFLFLALREIFKEHIACIATIISVFYLQTEVVQIFYDYIRVMDIFSCMTLLFLVKATKAIDPSCFKQYKKYLYTAGFVNSLFFLVKQNMGGAFFLYSLILISYQLLILHRNKSDIIKALYYFILGFFTPLFITSILMLFNGNFHAFFSQTTTEAIASKGGFIKILFGWFEEVFKRQHQGIKAIRNFLTILVFCFLETKLKPYSDEYKKKIDSYYLKSSCIFSFIIAIYILLLSEFKVISLLTTHSISLDQYKIFYIITLLFMFYVAYSIYLSVKKETIDNRLLLFITFTGSYFTISWGCGMSAGLVEGQATFGIAFAIAILLDSLKFKYSKYLHTILLITGIVFTCQCAKFKMIATYNWWGMTEQDYWANTQESKNIDILKGIKMSKENLNAYETIYKIVNTFTNENDPIYCFPQIPIIYSICHRKDPGVRAKVQWFDVASDKSIDKDIETITNNPPKAIIIFNTSEYAYLSHESLFRKNKKSATRKMKQFLLNFAQKNNYVFYGKIFTTNDNSLSLYYKKDNVFPNTQYFAGKGEKNNPYLINDINDLLELKRQVSNGNDFADTYFKQSQNIDCSSITNWKPIGEINSNEFFYGIYDGNGHTINNLKNSNGKNVSLFGRLGGIVCNLGLNTTNDNSATNSMICLTNTLDGQPAIINCFTKSSFENISKRGIASNFNRTIFNCISFYKQTIDTSFFSLISDSSSKPNFYNIEPLNKTGINLLKITNNQYVSIYKQEKDLYSQYLINLLNKNTKQFNKEIIYNNVKTYLKEITPRNDEDYMLSTNIFPSNILTKMNRIKAWYYHSEEGLILDNKDYK